MKRGGFTPTPLVVIALVILAAAVLTVAGACAIPTVLPVGVAVGSEVSCATPSMRRHCDAWVVAAHTSGLVAADAAASSFHVAWSTVPRTMEVRVVVVFTLPDGSAVDVPIFCGPYRPGDATCDLSDVSLPEH